MTKNAKTAHALETGLAQAASEVEATLARLVPVEATPYSRVIEAMRYAAFAGGKRLRPFMVLESARLFEVPRPCALRAAAAVEMVHTYSLVHDDLPAMDDDDLRRGKPTTHRAFDEATAILAGDALLTRAFEILADPETSPVAERSLAVIARLAQAAGAHGMIGGQMMDILAPGADYDLEAVIRLQSLKTGALFEFSAEAGPLLAGAVDADQHRLRLYARDLGLAFQIADDLIDATGTAESAGKAVGKDQERGKATFVSLMGVEGARREAARLAEACGGHLSVYGERAALLTALPLHLIDRVR